MNNPPSSTGTGILEQPSKKPTLLSALAGVCQLHSLPPVEVPFAVDVAVTTSCQHGPPPFHRHYNNPRSFETFSTLRGVSRDDQVLPSGGGLLRSGICVTTIHNSSLPPSC
uniref:(northern house mosquito) hypothetical protein n=1 Tax=Culex pipiens TaxID=7175 RepID=A0A8D8AYT8_CULPI